MCNRRRQILHSLNPVTQMSAVSDGYCTCLPLAFFSTLGWRKGRLCALMGCRFHHFASFLVLCGASLPERFRPARRRLPRPT